MSISDNSQDRANSMVTRIWSGRPGVRIQVEEWDYLGLLSKIPKSALEPLQAPIHYVTGGGVFPGSKAAGA